MEPYLIAPAASRMPGDSSRLVVLIRSTADRECVLSAVRRDEVALCSTAAGALAQSVNTVGIIYEAGMLDPSALRHFAECIGNRGGFGPLVLRIRLEPRHIRDLTVVTRSQAPVLVSLAGRDDLADLARRLLAGDERTGCITHLVRVIDHVAPSAIRGIVCGAVALGARRTDVRVLARFVGCGERTLAWRLRQAGAPPARALLGWSLAMHLSWRMAMLGWSFKRASSAAGFSDAKTCARYLRRHVARSPRTLRDELVFWELAVEFEHRLSRTNPDGRRETAAERDPVLASGGGVVIGKESPVSFARARSVPVHASSWHSAGLGSQTGPTLRGGGA